ncbi:MAG: hypothetical protein AB2A00_38920 [Myxococcota bacterium]
MTRGWQLAPLLALAACAPTTTETADAGVTISFSLTEHWPAPTDWDGFGAGMLVTTNNSDDTLTFLSLEDQAELFEAPVGFLPPETEGPHHVACDEGCEHLFIPISNYVPGTGSGPHGSHGTGNARGRLLKVDARTLLPLDSVVVDRSPGDILLAHDGKTLFVSHYDLVKVQEVLSRGGSLAEMASTVAIVDGETMEKQPLLPVCAGGHGMVQSQDGNTLYVACALADQVGVVDLASTPPVVTTVDVGESPITGPDATRHEPYALSIHPVDGKLWVSCLKSQSLRIYDPTTGTWTAGPTFDASPMFGFFNNDGTRFMVPIRESASVALVDTTTLELARPILTMGPETCENAHALEPSPDGTHTFLVCEGDHRGPGTVVTLATAVLAVVRATPVGVYPDAVKVVR